MTTTGQSPRALKQARRMELTPNEANPRATDIAVIDPRLNDRVIHRITVRTPQDLTRVKRALMGKYRIPPPNVSQVSAEPAEG